jgi:hypothetical protein
MNKTIEIKSMFLGLLVGVVAFVAIGAALKAGDTAGRYQIVAGPNRAYVLDTATGQVWQKMITDVVNDEDFAKPKP